jgi:hypothetical protein
MAFIIVWDSLASLAKWDREKQRFCAHFSASLTQIITGRR